MDTNENNSNNVAETPEKVAEKKPEKTVKKIRGKKYQTKKKTLTLKEYPLDEALKLLSDTSYTAFDPSVELHINVSTDPKKSDQIIRKIITIPHGIKRNLKILVFGTESELQEAKNAGATYLGNDEIIGKIKKGWVGFDKIITTPSMMPKITTLAKILGPKGLMPNVKNETITTKITDVLKNLLSGTTIELKNEKDFPIIHTIIGKLSFGEKKLKENFITLYHALVNAKPPKAKIPFIKSITMKTTMGPGIKIDINSIDK